MSDWVWSGRATWDDLAIWFIWVPMLVLFIPIFLVAAGPVLLVMALARGAGWLLKGVA